MNRPICRLRSLAPVLGVLNPVLGACPVLCLALLLLLPVLAPTRLVAQQPDASAQSAPPAVAPPAVGPSSNAIDIPVVVYDKKGAFVQDLTQDNFVLQVDGKPQTILYCKRDTGQPFTFGLLVDTAMGQRDALNDERSASSTFLDDRLKTPANRNKAFVVQFATQTDLLQDTTNSLSKLHDGLKLLQTAESSPDSSVTPVNSGPNNGPNSGIPSTPPRRNPTTLYDALFLSADEIMSKQPGRRVIVLFSDGVDSGSKESLTSSIEAAQRSGTIVFAIYVKNNQPANPFNRNQGRQAGQPNGYPGGFPGGGYPGMGYPGGGYPGGGYPGGSRQPQGLPSAPDGRKVLERMADETGGRLFEPSRRESFADIYKEIADELNAQYHLGYAPDKDTASDGYHRIDLSLTKSSPKNLYLQTRDGYYAGD